MAKIYVFVNQKGGVGKTTSVVNLGAYLAEAGKKVLLVDFDSQGNMSSGVGLSKEKPTIYELMAEQATAEQTIKKTPVANLDAIPASIDLSGAAIELVDQEDREFYLKKVLEPLRDKYDYILIDCPPNLSLLTVNALTAAGSVLIVQQAHYLALSGAGLLLDTVKLIKRRVNPGLDVQGILLTMYDSRTNHAKEIKAQVQEFFGDRVYNTVIRSSVALADAPAQGKDIFQFSPKSKAAADYAAFTGEIIEQEGKA